MSEPHRIPVPVALVALLACALAPIGPYLTMLAGHDDARIRALDEKIRNSDYRVEMGRAAERKLPQFREEVRRLHEEMSKEPCPPAAH